MHPVELDHRELLECSPASGLLRFAGQRALLIDALALGVLRRALLEQLGGAAAQTLLAQFGFAHGWRAAGALRAQVECDDDEWATLGARGFSLEGLGTLTGDPMAPGGATLERSWEAEQHLFHLGRSLSPVCWTTAGLLSGALSRLRGRQVVATEERCAATGDACCRFSARSIADLPGDREPGEPATPWWPTIDAIEAAERSVPDERRPATPLPLPASSVEHELVARSAAMHNLVELAQRIAPIDSTVLLTGESGTGKERIARLVHQASSRSTGPFLAVNCGAIAEPLLESELFGHARGAFTGATHERAGLFEAANRGTILLDEIGEVSPGMQVKLLRTLQEREVRRVGESRSRKIDVRVIAATNRDLRLAVEQGAFRQDLYYRLKVIELHVPRLRDRREDILPLARALLLESATRMKRAVEALSPAAAEQLLRHPWPGNVRELENAMERAVAVARGPRVELEDLPGEVRASAQGLTTLTMEPGVRPLEQVERDYILAALAHNDGNQTRTAQQLDIGTATLYRKLKAWRAPPAP